MAPKAPNAALPLTGSEVIILFQGGKGVRATVQGVWDGVPAPNIPVLSVSGRTGAIVLSKGDVGLGNADNTTDAGKPVSVAQAAAIAAGKLRVARVVGTTNASGIATVAFSPAFAATPDIDIIDGWLTGDQQVTGAVVSGTATPSGCQVQVMVSRGTLLLTNGPFQKAAAGVAITVRAIG